MGQKHQYRVKPGYRHGTHNQHGAGDLVELTAVEALPFGDKLELVSLETAQDVVESTLDPNLDLTGDDSKPADKPAAETKPADKKPAEPKGNKPSK